MALDYDVISQLDWDAVPAKQPKPPSEWEPILDDLENGKIVRLPLIDERDRRGKRLALGRRAAGRGFKVEMRTTESHLLARRSDTPYSAPEPRTAGTRRARTRRQTPGDTP
jgi:hypothetical protein